MKRQRRYITLLEMLIAMILVSVVLSAALYFYGYVIHVNQATEEVERSNFAMRYLQDRLSYVFTFAAHPKKKEQFFFNPTPLHGLFKDGTSALIFTYDNGINQNTPFSGLVLGCLYVDKAGVLRLTTWPDRKDWDESKLPPLHQEVFLDNIEGLSFEFYALPLKDSPVVPGTWVAEWKRDYKKLPGMVKVLVKRQGVPLTFAFPIPAEEATLIYH